MPIKTILLMLSNLHNSSKLILKNIPKSTLLLNTNYTKNRYYCIDTICDNTMTVFDTFIMSCQICGGIGFFTGSVYGFKVLEDIHVSLWKSQKTSNNFIDTWLMIPNFMFTPLIFAGIGSSIGVLYPITFPIIYCLYNDNKNNK